jgi:hypothetical protein
LITSSLLLFSRVPELNILHVSAFIKFVKGLIVFYGIDGDVMTIQEMIPEKKPMI